MSKQLQITLSDDWFRWVEDEAIHRGQSESELFEDALSAFLAELQANVQRLEDEAFHRKRLTTALEAVFNDSQRITRRKWANSTIYCGLEQSQLCIRGTNPDNLWHPWTITDEDWYADDWEVVE